MVTCTPTQRRRRAAKEASARTSAPVVSLHPWNYFQAPCAGVNELRVKQGPRSDSVGLLSNQTNHTLLMDPRQALNQDEWFRSRSQTIERALLVLLDQGQGEETQTLRAEVVHELRISLGFEQETTTS